MIAPKYSVVIPLYNKARCIARTVQSAVNQTYPPHEIIVVDDGSSDGSADVVSSLNERLVRLIVQKNSGVSIARNRGIEAATGDWIAFLDADDLWNADHLAVLAQTAADYPHAEIAANRYISVQEAEMETTEMWCHAVEESETEVIDCLPSRWMQGATFFTSSVAVKKELLQRVETWFPARESNGEDLDLWFRLAEFSSVVLSARVAVARVWTPDGLSVIHSRAKLPAFAERLELRAIAGRAPSRLKQPYLLFVTHMRLTNARVMISQGNRREALGVILNVHQGYRQMRWWITLAMATIVPATLVTKWQTWRKRRKMIIG